jgi:hypothetical protein
MRNWRTDDTSQWPPFSDVMDVTASTVGRRGTVILQASTLAAAAQQSRNNIVCRRSGCDVVPSARLRRAVTSHHDVLMRANRYPICTRLERGTVLLEGLAHSINIRTSARHVSVTQRDSNSLASLLLI